ncbi:hypothetical protein CRU87_09980, partial [Aliarcobacter trophiarum LMG 25534]
IAIRFLVTEEELKKRENFKRFLEQITEYKKKIGTLSKEKEELFQRLQESSNTIKSLDSRAQQIEMKRKQLLSQLEAYERNNLEFDKLNLMTRQDKTKQFEQMYEALNALKSVNRKHEKHIKDMEVMLAEKTEELDSFIKKDLENKKRINDLRDLVTNFQEEIEELKKQHHKRSLF